VHYFLLRANTVNWACVQFVAVFADGDDPQYNDQYSGCCVGSEIMIKL